MEKTMTLNLRVNPVVKQQAESILRQLGIPMATAIDMYLRQITLTGGLPFTPTLPKMPETINANAMSDSQLRSSLSAGYEDTTASRVKGMPPRCLTPSGVRTNEDIHGQLFRHLSGGG